LRDYQALIFGEIRDTSNENNIQERNRYFIWKEEKNTLMKNIQEFMTYF
jgi:hypothetical protein